MNEPSAPLSEEMILRITEFNIKLKRYTEEARQSGSSYYTRTYPPPPGMPPAPPGYQRTLSPEMEALYRIMAEMDEEGKRT